MGCGSVPGQELLDAAKRGDTATTQKLLDLASDTECADKNGKTPLLRAAKYGHVQVIVLLLQHDANLAATNKDRRTAMHIAAQQGHEPVLRFLMQSPGGSRLLELKDAYGDTPADLAADLPESKRAAVMRILQAPKPAAPPAPQINADSTGAGQQQRQEQPPQQPQQRAAPVVVPHVQQVPAPQPQPRVVPMPTAAPAPPPSAPVIVPHPEAPPPLVHPPPVRTVPVPAARPPPAPVAPPQPTHTPVQAQLPRPPPAAALTPRAAAPQPAAVAPAGTPMAAVATPRRSRGGSGDVAPAALGRAPGTPLAARSAPVAATVTPGTPLAPAGTPLARGAATPTPLTPMAVPLSAAAVAGGLATPRAESGDVVADDEAKEFGDLEEEGELSIEEQKAMAQAEWEAALAASLADTAGGGAARRSRWTKVEVTRDDYPVILAGAIELLDELDTAKDDVKLNGRKCRHLASRVESLRPVLVEFQSRLASGGDDFIPSDADESFKELLTDAYDVIDDAAQLVQDWAACSGGDFGALLKALVADEFAIEFSGLHCAVDDVLTALDTVAESLRIPLDDMPREWEGTFDEEEDADRDDLIPAALEAMRASPDAARACYKLLFTASLSTSDLLVALVEHGIATQGLDELTALIDEAGDKHKQEQEEFEREMQQAQQQSAADAETAIDDDILEAELAAAAAAGTPLGTPLAPGQRRVAVPMPGSGTPLGTPHRTPRYYPTINPAVPSGEAAPPPAGTGATPTAAPGAYVKEEFGEFQDAEEEFKNDADKC